MPWCVHCKKITRTERDEEGYLCCTVCGRVIDYANFSNEVTFVKGPGGQSHVSGTLVKSVESDNSSRERTLRKGEDEIRDMVLSLNISEDVVDQASRFYKIAVDRNFTRGRRTSLVAASCVYIVCRENKKPYLLIDFSEYLAVSVYMLGAVFLQLCQLLRLEEHPIFQKLVDPSLFIHRFTERLLGCKNPGVSKDALRIVASMKRDWMQTGRKPSGLCGAALYISALSYGLKYSKADVVSVVHVCEATLTKRLIEFENTESGSLTIEEFNMKAEELEREGVSRQQPNPATKSSGLTELLCQHKGTSKAHFAHGLCKACYDDFIIISGGLQGGSEPPAFQHAERDRMAKAAAEEKSKESSISEEELEPPSKHNRHVNEDEKRESSPSSGATIGNQAVDDDAFGQPLGNEDMDAESGGESESLSDIDDAELDGYFNNEEEQCKKKIIWEEMNKEYLEEQAAKEAAAAAAREAYEANFQNCSEESLAARELAAATAAAVAKNRKERKRKRDAEAKNASPPQTAAEAAQEVFTRKRISSKINYDVLKKLLNGDSMDSENTKKKRIESDANDHPTKEVKMTGNEEEPESDLVDNDDNTLQEDDYGEEGYGEESYGYGNDSYYGNEEEGYSYDEDYGYEEC